MDARVNSLLSVLAQPATPQMRRWQPSMKDDGRNLLRRCLVASDPACKGLATGHAPVANVTVTLGSTSQDASDDAFRLDDSCTLQTVHVKANHATQGMCLTDQGKPIFSTLVLPVTTLIEGSDPPEYRHETKTVLVDLSALNIFSLTRARRYSGRLEQIVPRGTDKNLPKCDASGLSDCRLTTVRDGCLAKRNGKCVKQLARYYCPATREETRWTCERQQREVEACQGDACEQPDSPPPPQQGVSHSADFAQAMVMLETARQAGNYLLFSDEELQNLVAFHGTYSECRDKIAWGLGDCCRGGAPTDTHNRAALANLGVHLAIRGVEARGSPHVHDLLFVGSDLKHSLKGLGAGGTGLASAFSPSFSLYGVEVGLSNNVISFGFDPTAFAVAVALSVVANLLECDQAEKLLGLRVGNGLCFQTASWCSDGSWFGCKEERESYCCYNSRLARIIAKAAKRQLRRPPNDCGGLSQEELERVDFGAIDLSEVIEEFAQPGTDTDELLRRYQVANAGRYATVTAVSP